MIDHVTHELMEYDSNDPVYGIRPLESWDDK